MKSSPPTLETATNPVTGTLDGRRIVLGVCGGIAAYKSVYLCRRLLAAGATVQVVMTAAAAEFVTAHTFQAISGRPVRSQIWDSAAEAAMSHIELARWADLILIAPATANTLAQLRLGMANDLLTTVCLASPAPLFIAPAMNQGMWQHPATQDNLQQLLQRGVRCIGPDQGDQACGDVGPGRMVEPEQILAALEHALSATSGEQVWRGQHVLITAGPTYEDIDPVRFIGNRSSGRMGYALAAAAARAGAAVTLVSGPVELAPPAGVTRISVRSAVQMYEQVMARAAQSDIFIAAAAVADYRVAEPAEHKLKKQYTDESAAGLRLELVANPDILAQVCALAERPYCVGFAAETENLAQYAEAKRQRKGADLIAANWVGNGRGFETQDNALWVFGEGFDEQLPSAHKRVLAEQLVQLIERRRCLSRSSG